MFDINDPIIVWPNDTFTVRTDLRPEQLEIHDDYMKFKSLKWMINRMDECALKWTIEEAKRVELVERLNDLNETLNIALSFVDDSEKWEALVAKQSLAMNRSDLNDYDIALVQSHSDNHFSRNASWLRIRCRELEKTLLDTVSLNENTNSIAREVLHKCPSVGKEING